jgi:hypothetical protein
MQGAAGSLQVRLPRRVADAALTHIVPAIITALVSGILVVAPLCGGTAERPYTLLVAAASACACLLLLVPRRGAPQRASWFLPWLLVASAFTLLQAVPLPAAVRAVFAPGSDADLRQILSGLFAGGRAFPLSLDPGATLHEAVRLLGYACLLFVLTNYRERIAPWICVSAALCAGLGVCAGLGLSLPPPLAVPQLGATRALFPAGLYNSNHLAALQGLGALFCLAAALGARERQRAGLYLALWALCTLVLIGTLSRAGIVVWLLAQAVLLVLQGRRRRRGLLLLVALLGIFCGLVLWGGALPALHSRFAATSLPEITAPGGKLHAWIEAWPLLRGHLLFGVGRGAFENAFQHVQALSGRLRFAYLENEWLQVVLDWGAPAAVVLFGLLFLALRDALGALFHGEKDARAAAPRPALVALLALAGLGLHNLLDFNLEVGGIAVLAVALCALCQHPRFVLPGRFAPALACVLGGLTLLLAGLVQLRFPDHDEDGARLRALCEDPAVSVDAVLAAGRAAALRHPLDGYLPALVAARLQADSRPESHGEAQTWVNQALLANPRDVLARRTGAALLVESGHRAQGLLLLSSAIADADAATRRPLLLRLCRWAQSPDEVMAALPDETALRELLEILGDGAAPPWSLVRALAERALTNATAATADRAGAAVWLGRAALALRDGAAAEAAARALLFSTGGGEGVPPLLFADLAELCAESGRAAVAEALLEQALARGERAELLLALGRLHLQKSGEGQAGSPESMLRRAAGFLERALALAASPALAARIHEVYGDLEARAGNPHQATVHRLEAARLRRE